MKTLKATIILTLLITLLGCAFTSRADDQKVEKLKPYPLDTCLVCDMELGMMGEPYQFIYQGRQIKVCHQAEKAQFDKNPAKYLKKLDEAAAKLKK